MGIENELNLAIDNLAHARERLLLASSEEDKNKWKEEVKIWEKNYIEAIKDKIYSDKWCNQKYLESCDSEKERELVLQQIETEKKYLEAWRKETLTESEQKLWDDASKEVEGER